MLWYQDALDYLDLLAPDGQLTFQTFSDRADLKIKRVTPQGLTKLDDPLAEVFHLSRDEHPEWSETFKELNRKGAGVYLTVNQTDGRGRKAENVVGIRAWFIDVDGLADDQGGKDELFGKLVGHDLPPSIIVHTRAGFHAYWLCEEAEKERPSHEQFMDFKRIQTGLLGFWGGDPKIKDLSRVLRMPCWYGRKDVGKPFRMSLEISEQWYYSAADMLTAFPPPPGTRSTAYAPVAPAKSLNLRKIMELRDEAHLRWVSGQRNEVAKGISARLYYAGVPEGEAVSIVQGIAQSVGDEEVGDRVQVVLDTYRKGRQGNPISVGEAFRGIGAR